MPVIIDRGIEEYREPEVIGWVGATRRAAVGLCGLFVMPEGPYAEITLTTRSVTPWTRSTSVSPGSNSR